MLIKKQLVTLWQYVIDFFTKGHQRSVDAKRNIVGALFIKGVSISIGLVLVPLTINYVSPSQYGIWVTLSSMIAWISFFDIGFTHGLRNKFAAAKAKGDIHLARIYISTAYFYVGIIFTSLWILLLGVNQFITWHNLLNIPAGLENEVSRLAVIVLSYFCFQFIFRILITILVADQKPALGSLIDMLGQLITLGIIFALTRFTSGSLIYLGLASCIAPATVLAISNIIFFRKKYKAFTPSLKFVKKEYAKDIMNLGVKFFILQIASIVQFESILFLIAHYFDTVQVTAYNIAYKYFFTLQMGFSILLTPLWSGVTDAHNSGDHAWIKNAVNKYLKILVPFILLGIFMLLIADWVYEVWLGKNVVEVSHNMSLLCLIFFSTGMFASIFISVINGVGALKVLLYVSIITSILFFCFAILFIRQFHLGVESILISSIIANVGGYIIAPIQYYQIFFKRSSAEVWHK